MEYAIYLTMFLAVGMVSYGVTVIVQTTYPEYEKRVSKVSAGQLRDMFIFMTPDTIMTAKIALMVILALVGGILGGILAAIVMAALGFGIPTGLIWYIKRRRLRIIDEQVPAAIATVANGMKAGYNLTQALESSAKETPPPISQELTLTLREHKMGVELETALKNLVDRVPLPDLRLVVVSMNINRMMGGNLPDMLEKIAYTIRERRRIEGKNKALTSQGKLQGIVVAMLPVGLGVVFYMLDPKMMSYMFTTTAGIGLLFLMAVMEIIGFVIIQKIVSIDV